MVLSSIHNRANHPIRHQLSQIMKRYFFTSGLKNQIDKLFKQCTICVATRKFKKQTARSTEPQPPKAPGTQVNTDIIKCAVQLIIVTLDLFTNYVTTTIILAEKKEAIIDGIVNTTFSICISVNISVRTDRALALQVLALNILSPLCSIGITLQLPNDAFNKNANCHVDRAIQ